MILTGFTTIYCVFGYTCLHNSSKNVTFQQINRFSCYGKPFFSFSQKFPSTWAGITPVFCDDFLPFVPLRHWSPPPIYCGWDAGKRSPGGIDRKRVLCYSNKVKGNDEDPTLCKKLREEPVWWNGSAPLLCVIPLLSHGEEMPHRVRPLKRQ